MCSIISPLSTQKFAMEVTMSAQLPDALVQYFDAQNRHDVDAMVAAFAPDAEVTDEGCLYRGRESIRAWKSATTARYAVQVTPLRSMQQSDDSLLVEARVSGNFPGSPADLSYRFALGASGHIRKLKIR
jgi:hypothetical protein